MQNSFSSTITVNKQAEEVFAAIINFKLWWSEDILGTTDQIGDVFLYHYKDVHLCKLKMIELLPNKKVVYLVLDNFFNFTKDKTEWVNTKLVFELENDETKTRVTFTHEGLVKSYECYNVCDNAWTKYIQESLQNLIVFGKGKPNDKEGGNYGELAQAWAGT